MALSGHQLADKLVVGQIFAQSLFNPEPVAEFDRIRSGGKPQPIIDPEQIGPEMVEVADVAIGVQQVVDRAAAPVGGIAGIEPLRLFERWDSSSQIEVDPAQKRGVVRGRVGRQPLGRQLFLDQQIDLLFGWLRRDGESDGKRED